MAAPSFCYRGGRWLSCAVCVPAGDKRSAYLSRCSEAQAACRGLFYAPPRAYAGVTALACDAAANQPITAQLAATPAFGCPSNTTDFAFTTSNYP